MAGSKIKGLGVDPLGFGECNQIGKPDVYKSYDPRETSFLKAASQIVKKSFEVDVLNNTGPYKGIVLRVENTITTSGHGPNGWLQRISTALGEAPPEVLALKVRIPEIHSMYPHPEKYDYSSPGDPESERAGPHQKIIDMHPTFISTGKATERYPRPVPGDLVWVDFVNKNDFKDGIYLRPVGGSALAIAAGTEDLSEKFHPSDTSTVAGNVPPGQEPYSVSSNKSYGPGWNNRRPPGLPENARRCGKHMSARKEILSIATNMVGPDFARVMLDLASTESGARYGRPARPPYSSNTGWGAYQWDKGAWEYAGFLKKYGMMWDVSPTDELALPITYYSKLWRKVISKGGNSLAAARHIRVWHRSPVAAKRYRKLAANGNWMGAWDEIRRVAKPPPSKPGSKWYKWDARAVRLTDHDMTRIGFA